mmetsp:Transcript_18621/g.36507  ORF Transcript_18621/g.36507 Transcript_18621/m.36507 type:complete len:524 (+) Transcript_18621:67-1638(+)
MLTSRAICGERRAAVRAVLLVGLAALAQVCLAEPPEAEGVGAAGACSAKLGCRSYRASSDHDEDAAPAKGNQQLQLARTVTKGTRTDALLDALPEGPGPAAINRTLAVTKIIEMRVKSGQLLQLTSAVPVFVNTSDSYIALIFKFNPPAWEAVTASKFLCESPDHKKSAAVEWFGGETKQPYPLAIVGRCRWPVANKQRCYRLGLTEEGGGSAGDVEACHEPDLATEGPFRLASCGHAWWDEMDHPAFAGSLLLPPWVEYQLLRGVQHFFWYTDSRTQPSIYAAMEPYFKQGVATRIHSHTPLDRHDWDDLNDCLYRTRHRAEWMMPTVDLDEFIRPSPYATTDRTLPEMFDALAALYTNVTHISFGGFRFLKPDDPKHVSVVSALREPAPQALCPKYVVRPWAANTLFVHWPISMAEGSQTLAVPVEELSFNHYRTRDRTLMNTTDTTLESFAAPLYQKLRKRFQKPWAEVAQDTLESLASVLLQDSSVGRPGVDYAALFPDFVRLFQDLKAPRIVELPSYQ